MAKIENNRKKTKIKTIILVIILLLIAFVVFWAIKTERDYKRAFPPCRYASVNGEMQWVCVYESDYARSTPYPTP
jgi:hypothetical protein